VKAVTHTSIAKTFRIAGSLAACLLLRIIAAGFYEINSQSGDQYFLLRYAHKFAPQYPERCGFARAL